MNEALGVVDAFEAKILDAKRIPFSGRIVLDEKQCLQLIDKLRYLLQNTEERVARQVIDSTRDDSTESLSAEDEVDEAQRLMREAESKSHDVKRGANDYADNVLARLQLLVTQLQKNLVGLERNIENGRGLIDEVRSESGKEKTAKEKEEQLNETR